MPSATGKTALASGSSGANKEGSSFPVRLVVNATSNSEISSNPILGDGLAGAVIPGEISQGSPGNISHFEEADVQSQAQSMVMLVVLMLVLLPQDALP